LAEDTRVNQGNDVLTNTPEEETRLEHLMYISAAAADNDYYQ